MLMINELLNIVFKSWLNFLIFYSIGLFVVLLMGVFIYRPKTKDKNELDCDKIIRFSLLSWLSFIYLIGDFLIIILISSLKFLIFQLDRLAIKLKFK